MSECVVSLKGTECEHRLRHREESSRARARRAVVEVGGDKWVKGTRGVGLLV
jgi:hypothetical protein